LHPKGIALSGDYNVRTASSYRAKLISSVYMRKVKQGPLETEWLPIVSDFLIHHTRMRSMVWGKYAVAQNTETSNIPLNKKEGKNHGQNQENVVEEAQA
jgi:hypothetical protein